MSRPYSEFLAEQAAYAARERRAFEQGVREAEAKRISDSWLAGVASIFGVKPKPSWLPSEPARKGFDAYVDQALTAFRNDPEQATEKVLAWVENKDPDVYPAFLEYARNALGAYIERRAKKRGRS